MHVLGWGEDGEVWGWRRQLMAWEEELVEEVKLLFANVSLQDSSMDAWLWCPNTDDGYTVCGVYMRVASFPQLVVYRGQLMASWCYSH
ncbi:hypothetical protein MTR_3g082355 [Medicago truncatula]|uniref:Uncharacterized protein n=1 Tax=Medicago truncatula TaxID=3880 RepID=A0A072V1G7_MEDTR|nr:hypothetical protein MTR_3g082355 [Medicago truncatula]